MAQVIGTAPNQVPSNSNLGDLAYRNKAQIAGEFATAAQGTTADTALQPADLGATDLPDIAPTLNLDFANAQSITSKTTYTRASTATYYDANGTLQTAAVDAPRFDHDPVTGERLGILLEEQRTNLLTYSEQLDNVAWTKIDSTITANAVTAPDGTTTADKYISGSGIGEGLATLYQDVSASPSTAYTLSVYAKADELSILKFSFIARTGAGSYISEATYEFDLSNQTSTITGASLTGSSSSITEVGNGWYLCSITATTTASTGIIRPYVRNTTTGDGTSGIYLWGAQLEAGSFPTSYIKTEASQVTRSADDLSITGTNFTDFYNQSEGTFLVGMDYVGGTTSPVLFSAGTPFGDVAYISHTGSNLNLKVFTGSVDQFAAASISRPSTPFKVAFALKQDDMAFVVDGGTVSTDTSGTIPTVTNLYLGRASWTAGNYACIHIKSLTYYPRRLTNAQLQSLTTE